MSLDRFIFCPCKHNLEAHAAAGCSRCACHSSQRDVIDGLLEIEREAIHRTWLGSSTQHATESARAAN